MKKTLLSALKHGSGILLTLFSLLCSCQVWAEEYTIYFLRPSGEGRWGNTPRVHIYYNDGSSDHVIVDGGTSDGDMSNVAAELYSKTFETDKTSIYLIFNNGGWGNNTKSDTYGPWTPVSDTYFTTSNEYVQPVTTYAVRQFSAGEYIYLKNIKPGGWSDNWISSTCQYAYLYMWGGTAGVHTYRFNLVSGYGDEYALNSIYGAQIQTAGTYAYFILTRGQSECADGGFPSVYNNDKTGDVPFDATKNYITDYTKDVTSVTWDVFNPCTEPTVTTASSPAAKGATTATLTGTYTTADVCVPTAKGVAYKEDGGAYSYQPDGTSASGSISVSLSDLTPLTTYYYKAYVELEGGEKVYGAEYSFTTDCRSGITISAHPSTSAQEACLGSATALSVTASGASDYTYQWYYNSTASVSGATAIPGATASSYTPAVVGTNYYYCSIGAAGGYCEVSSNFSGAITIKGVPSLTATPSSVTNYAPVTITASGAEISDWNITSGTGGYLYKKSATSAKFKGNVGSSSTPVTYTIQGTANGCSGSTTVTVNKNADSCE